MRMVAEMRPDYPSERTAIGAVAQKLGIGSFADATQIQHLQIADYLRAVNWRTSLSRAGVKITLSDSASNLVPGIECSPRPDSICDGPRR